MFFNAGIVVTSAEIANKTQIKMKEVIFYHFMIKKMWIFFANKKKRCNFAAAN